jgi:hypothetical protein
MPPCGEKLSCKANCLPLDGHHACALCVVELHGICGHFYQEESIKFHNICMLCKLDVDKKQCFISLHNLPPLPHPMMVEDVMELLPSIYQRSSALQTLIIGSSGDVSSDADVSKKPAAKGKKKVSAKPAKEKKKKAQKATVVKNSTISIPKMVNDTTISMSNQTISVTNLLSSLTAAASEAPAVAETSTTAVAEEAAETPTTHFSKYDATPTELHFNNVQAQKSVDEGDNNDVADSVDKGDKLCCSYKKCNNALATK